MPRGRRNARVRAPALSGAAPVPPQYARTAGAPFSGGGSSRPEPGLRARNPERAGIGPVRKRQAVFAVVLAAGAAS